MCLFITWKHLLTRVLICYFSHRSRRVSTVFVTFLLFHAVLLFIYILKRSMQHYLFVTWQDSVCVYTRPQLDTSYVVQLSSKVFFCSIHVVNILFYSRQQIALYTYTHAGLSQILLKDITQGQVRPLGWYYKFSQIWLPNHFGSDFVWFQTRLVPMNVADWHTEKTKIV